jgi:hypothetical protein
LRDVEPIWALLPLKFCGPSSFRLGRAFHLRCESWEFEPPSFLIRFSHAFCARDVPFGGEVAPSGFSTLIQKIRLGPNFSDRDARSYFRALNPKNERQTSTQAITFTAWTCLGVFHTPRNSVVVQIFGPKMSFFRHFPYFPSFSFLFPFTYLFIAGSWKASG